MANTQPLFIEIGEGLSLMLGLPTIATWNKKTRPKKPKEGTIGFNIETNNLEYWNGTFWLESLMQKV